MLSKKQIRIMLAIPVTLALLVSLLLHAPVSMMSSRLAVMLPQEIRDQGVMFGGTLLDGQLQMQQQSRPLYLAWQLRLNDLWRLAYGADIQLAGPVALKATWLNRLTGWTVSVSEVSTQAGDARWLQPELVLPSWHSAGMTFARDDNGNWSAADGELQSDGGAFRINLQGQIQEMQLPAATLRWRVVNNSLVGELRQREDGGALAAITLTADQRIQWQIRERLLRLKPGYLGQNDLDLVVLTVSEPLLPPGA